MENSKTFSSSQTSNYILPNKKKKKKLLLICYISRTFSGQLPKYIHTYIKFLKLCKI